jgi:hypothetical protein
LVEAAAWREGGRKAETRAVVLRRKREQIEIVVTLGGSILLLFERGSVYLCVW